MTLQEQLQAWAAWRQASRPPSIQRWIADDNRHDATPPLKVAALVFAFRDLRQGDRNTQSAVEAVEVHYLFTDRPPALRQAALGIGWSTYWARIQWGRSIIGAYFIGTECFE